MQKALRSTPSLALLFSLGTSIAIGGLALAGDSKASYAASGDSKSKVECHCGAFAMYKADIATLCKNVALGIAPASFCEGTPDAACAEMKKNPSDFYAGVFMYRLDEVDTALAAVKRRFVSTDATESDRARLLDFAVHFPVKTNDTITAELWKVAPKSFSTDHMLALASGAPSEIKAELQNRAPTEVKVAAWFALDGNACGKELLIRAVKDYGTGKGALRDAAVAAIGMEALGNSQTLGRVLSVARTRALAALDAGNLCEARTIALEGNYFAQAASKGKTFPVAWMSAELDAITTKKAEKLATAEDIFKVIETIQS